MYHDAGMAATAEDAPAEVEEKIQYIGIPLSNEMVFYGSTLVGVPTRAKLEASDLGIHYRFVKSRMHLAISHYTRQHAPVHQESFTPDDVTITFAFLSAMQFHGIPVLRYPSSGPVMMWGFPVSILVEHGLHTTDTLPAVVAAMNLCAFYSKLVPHRGNQPLMRYSVTDARIAEVRDWITAPVDNPRFRPRPHTISGGSAISAVRKPITEDVFSDRNKPEPDV